MQAGGTCREPGGKGWDPPREGEQVGLRGPRGAGGTGTPTPASARPAPLSRNPRTSRLPHPHTAGAHPSFDFSPTSDSSTGSPGDMEMSKLRKPVACPVLASRALLLRVPTEVAPGRLPFPQDGAGQPACS